MRIKVWASTWAQSPTIGPYKLQDILERESFYALGDMTHYGEVIQIPPPIPPFNEDADQSVIVRLNLDAIPSRPEESVFEKPPTSYAKIEFFPIPVDLHNVFNDEPPPSPAQSILSAENLTAEDVSRLINPDTFSLWRKDCFISQETAQSLDNVKYALVHRYSSEHERDDELEKHSTELLNLTVACLALVRPTRRNRAMNIRGLMKADGAFYPHGFSFAHQPAEVPQIQKLFTIRKRDVDLLSSVLPEFIKLYQKDAQGNLKDEYEPLRMAVQLYSQAYAIPDWKLRHILWWSAIEALYGNNEDAAKARIYAFFGNKNLLDGYRHPVYESGDIPPYSFSSPESVRTLGMMVPVLYEVRNASAHGQKVPDVHFSEVPHPLGPTPGIDALAEAATFIIRKTVIAILQSGLREKFRDRDSREVFWLYEFGLDKRQSRKRLRNLYDTLGLPTGSLS
jgi:hypothetical protein